MTETIPGEMTAIAIKEPGGPEALVPTSLSVPKPGQDEVLIRVAAAGVNRPDIVQRQGFYPPPPGAPDTPGLEIAGEVVAIGAGSDTLTPDVGIGDNVCALVAGGGYAAYCVAPAATCLPAPKGLSLVEAAAIPETFFTVWSNVFDRAGLQAGEALLVHGGSSGIGTTAIQLAKCFGSTVYTTAGSEEKCASCLELGADRAINYKSEDFVEIIRSETKDGVNVVLDMVGGDYIPRNIKCLAPDGRHVSIAFLRGGKVEMEFSPVMLKRLTLTGSTLRPRDVAFKAAIAKKLRERVWPMLESGKIRPVIDSTFPLEQAAAAHQRMESSAHTGKIMLVAGN